MCIEKRGIFFCMLIFRRLMKSNEYTSKELFFCLQRIFFVYINISRHFEENGKTFHPSSLDNSTRKLCLKYMD